MSDTTQHLADVLDSRAPVNNSETFNYLLDVREQAWQIVNEGLSLREDLTCKDIEHIPDLQGNIVGNMHTYTGDKSPIDWIVRSWIGKPETGFTNIHLTCWVGDEIDVPHLGFALGTAPDVFCYVDYLPRYEAVATPSISTSITKALNENGSPCAATRPTKPSPRFTFTPAPRCRPSPFAACSPLPISRRWSSRSCSTYVRNWVELVKTPTRPAEKRAALKARDELVRRTIVEKDPANVLADRMLGVPMRERLVRILHAGEREA
jgi:hypothetical protein